MGNSKYFNGAKFVELGNTNTSDLINDSGFITSADGGNADMVDGKHASAFANASHTHSYLPLTGGTMTGILTANSNTAYSTKQMRNVIISTLDADVNAMDNGDIWIKI